MRPVAAAEQLGEMAQPAMLDRLREIGVDRILDPRHLVDVGAAGEQRQPVDQELAVDRRVGQLERVEPGGLARPQHVVAAADRADEQLGAAVLVEEDDPRAELARLGEQEVQHHRLARARRADDGEIAEVALVEVEVIGPGGGGLEQGHRLAPVIAVGLAEREVVAARRGPRNCRSRPGRAGRYI